MLKRLKLLDIDDRVSLTNLSIYVVLFVIVYSVIHSGQLDMNALGALLTVLGAQRAKMWQLDKEQVSKLKAELAEARSLAGRAPAAPRMSATLPAGLR
jgi:hypothetical protein